MIEFSDLSIEVAHIYMDSLDKQMIENLAKITASWIKPILEIAEERKRVVSTTVLIDDYFSGGKISLMEASDAIVSALRRHDVEIDHVVPESDCADGIEMMFDFIVEQPRKGAGSRGGETSPPVRTNGWLSNGDSMRLNYKTSSGDPFQSLHRPVFIPEPRYSHSLFLDVQLWSEEERERVYSCPALAAWWQLIRLGVHENADGAPKLPNHIISRPGASPFFALKTVSALSVEFLEIEHAVRTILSQVFIPKSARQRWRRGPCEPGAQGHLERIAYLFFPTDFDFFSGGRNGNG